MIRVLSVFGTRPEAIKMAPVVRELEKRGDRVESRICVTAQHRQMLDQVNHLFGIHPDIDLNVMTEDQALGELTSTVLAAITEMLRFERPDVVLVQGDTTTVFAAALASFYLRIPVGHVEAGLRTRDRYNPFPEEINRRLVGSLATYHFAPTQSACEALIGEGVSPGSITVTGNTVVDALLHVVGLQNDPREEARLESQLASQHGLRLDARRLVLVTGHRRESFGRGFENICAALLDLAEEHATDMRIVYPVHLNPNVRRPVNRLLSGVPNIQLIEPVDYYTFVYLMSKSSFILTDSGGVQEEAPSLGKPVLIMREKTERPEGIEAGTAKLVGTDRRRIFNAASRLLRDDQESARFACAENPFGDGHAAERIVEALLEKQRYSR